MNQIIVHSAGHDWQVTIRDEADESVAAEIFRYHEYRVAEDVIRSSHEPILDVGAHSGLFTLYARSLNSKVKILAVEPEPHNYDQLLEHIAVNKISGITPIAAALAGTSGEAGLFLSPDSHNHSLLESYSNGQGEAIAVPALSFADLRKKYKIKRFGLVKMDIEGGEYAVFDQLVPSEYEAIRSLIMEYHRIPERSFKEIEERLRENGFGVQIFPSKFDKTMGFLWAINKRLKI